MKLYAAHFREGEKEVKMSDDRTWKNLVEEAEEATQSLADAYYKSEWILFSSIFLEHYFLTFELLKVMDQKRANIGQFYSPEAILVYEGNRTKGQGSIAEFYQKFPPSSHRITSLDAQPIDKVMTDGNKAILISGKFEFESNFEVFFVLC